MAQLQCFRILVALSLVVNIATHSWVERLYVTKGGEPIEPPGYPRGNVLRTPSFRDEDMTYRLPPAERNEIWQSDLACKSSQITYNQTTGSPSLRAQPNDTVILLYQENGHVTKVADDPGHATSGTIAVFGTLHSLPTDTLQYLALPKDDGGAYDLLELASYDDGLCYQDNKTPIALERQSLHHRPSLPEEGTDVWCGITIQLPKHVQKGQIYTLVWVWNFQGIGFDEVYTTCIDIIMY
ncbi:uncharacterized protein SETTUDRAFT_97251 [Exserohilum turcica Et28A]|uniref:DUF7492 domain-containing protein n=1 Tax=Exserohilum turcicum (strain 28A) TaxID=671987 RepID=R0JX25_EXST2|nr:uncharacterized protein SETTUDRAFT_97251 [Exserohilum turcica Et28A]EOA82039.1 hypothetical protein SETTUDRAFT_97251 [Exserohilum turcica Et28A]